MIRGLKLIPIENWLGFDQFVDAEELPPNAFSDSLNVVVLPNGNIAALRSPANFNNALPGGNLVLSTAQFTPVSTVVLLFDATSTGATVDTWSTTGTTNTLIRSGQANAPFQSIPVDNGVYRVNGVEFIQYKGATGIAYNVGITAPFAAPVAVLTTGGSGTLETGVYLSYCYYNATTGHYGQCSAPSGITGSTSGGAQTIALNVVGSSEAGVGYIAVFISQDGGVLRYLLIDSAGNTVFFANTTGTITIDVSDIITNLNVEETAYNAPPPVGITFISRWKNRIIGTLGRFWQYSGFDQIAAGIPWEAWPPLNVLAIPNKGEVAQGGIETQVGWLGFSDLDAYLISGTPTDKVDSGENTLQITEQLDPLGWSLGTKSPLTIKNTPYGTVWLDQNQHLQLWPWEGQPIPIALGIWPDLANISSANLGTASAEWFPAGGASGGFYVLTASTSSSVNNRCWFVMMIRTQDGLRVIPCPSSIDAQCVCVYRVNGKPRCFIGVPGRVREILNFDLEGAGWGTDEIYAEFIAGNQLTNFNRLHSLRFDGENPQDLIVRVSNLDDSDSTTIPMEREDGPYFGLVDRYAPRHKVTLAFPNDDRARHEIKNMRLAMGNKGRVI